MLHVLVTGAAGFIGSHTVDLLLAQGHRVCGVDNLRTGRRENLAAALRQDRSFTFHEQDITAPGVLDPLVAATRPDAIIHLAALVSVPESLAHPAENDRLNFQATRLVAAAALRHGVPRIVFASSAAIYGDNPHLPLHEDEPAAPLSPYGAAKLASEQHLLELARTYGITVRCHRYFNVFGPRQDPTSSYSGVISRFAAVLATGLAPTIHGDGEQTRDFIAVADVARANLIAASAPGLISGVANICTGQAVSLNELYRTMGRVFGRDLPARHGTARAGDIRHSLGSPARAERELGFRAALTLEEGLRQLAADGRSGH